MSSLFRIKRKDLTRLIVGVFTLTAKGLHFSQIAMRIFLTLIEYLVMSLLSLTRPGLTSESDLTFSLTQLKGKERKETLSV